MKFEECQEQGVLIARPLEHRLDAAVSQEFKQYMTGRVQAGHQLIAIDLGEVEFVDSSGLGAIISVLKGVGEGGGIAVFGAGSNVQSLFRLTRLDRVIPVLNSVEDALLALTNSSTPLQT